MTRSALLSRIGSKTAALNSATGLRPAARPRASGMPAASALRDRADPRPAGDHLDDLGLEPAVAAIRSIRFCSVVPPPETQTARRIGGDRRSAGARGGSAIGFPLGSARKAVGTVGSGRHPTMRAETDECAIVSAHAISGDVGPALDPLGATAPPVTPKPGMYDPPTTGVGGVPITPNPGA